MATFEQRMYELGMAELGWARPPDLRRDRSLCRDTYRWMFREGVLEQPEVDLVLADVLHERRMQNEKIVDRIIAYLTLAIAALAVEAAEFAIAAALAS